MYNNCRKPSAEKINENLCSTRISLMIVPKILGVNGVVGARTQDVKYPKCLNPKTHF